MKFNKIISALMGGAFLFGMAACTDEVEYTPADVIPGNNVYFPVDESTTVEIGVDATTCEIDLYRENADETLTVGLEGQVVDKQGNPQTDIFTVPTQVTFPAGVKKVPIVIDVVLADVVPEYEYQLALKVKGEDNSIYGLTERTFTLVYSPWSEWKIYRYDPATSKMIPINAENYNDQGVTAMATVTLQQLVGGVYEVPLYVRGSLVNDNKFQLLFPDPQAYEIYNADPDYDPTVATGDINTGNRFVYNMTIDKAWTFDNEGVQVPFVLVPHTATPFTYQGGSIYFADVLSFYTDTYNGEYTLDEVYLGLLKRNDITPAYYDEPGGMIVLNTAMSTAALDINGQWLGSQVETVLLPGFKDYGVTMEYTGNFVNQQGKESAQIQAVKGADVTSFAYKCVAGALTQAQVDAVAEEIKADANAELIYDAAATLSFTLPEDGKYTVVTVSYNEGGEAVATTAYAFDYKTVQAEREWVSVGTCKYTDGLIYGHFSFDGETYIGGDEWDVEVEASTKQKGRYRLVNAYAAWPFAIAYAQAGRPVALTDKDYYIYFDARYSNATYMENGEIGVDFANIGISGAMSMDCDCYSLMNGQNKYPLELVASAGYAGTVEDGIVAFPAGTFGLYYGSKGAYTNFSDELYDAMDAWTGAAKDFWNTIPDPSYGMGYTTIDMSGVSGEYAPGQETLNISTNQGAAKKVAGTLANKVAKRSNNGVQRISAGVKVAKPAAAKASAFKTFKGKKSVNEGYSVSKRSTF